MIVNVNKDKKNSACIHIDPIELIEAPGKTNDPTNPDSNNGLITSIWGPPCWETFHSITFGYPIKPTEEQKNDYLNFFVFFGKVLPCSYCRISYAEFIKEPGTFLDMKTMESRETLTKWGFELHNRVNKKLGVNYGETYQEMCYKFESYRAKCTKTDKGCLMPLDIKAKSYQKAKIIRSPIIDIKYCYVLKEHAKTLGLINYNKYLEYFSKLTRNTIEWGDRDCNTRHIINYMRKNGINALDENGLPSFYEMILISMLCSTLDTTKLDILYNRLHGQD